jgi:hypothetical protein
MDQSSPSNFCHFTTVVRHWEGAKESSSSRDEGLDARGERVQFPPQYDLPGSLRWDIEQRSAFGE